MKKQILFLAFLVSSILSFGQVVNNTPFKNSISIDGLNKLSTDSALRINVSRPHKDIIADISTSASTATDWTIEQYATTGYQIPFLRHDQQNYIYGKIQYNHDKALGVPIDDVHLHAVGMASVTGNVRLVVWYKWINYNQVLPIDTSAGAGTWTRTKLTVPIAGTDQYKVQVINVLSDIAPPANETPSSILFFIVLRDGASTLDTYTANKGGGGTNQCNFGLFYSDSHYTISKLGSKGEVTD